MGKFLSKLGYLFLVLFHSHGAFAGSPGLPDPRPDFLSGNIGSEVPNELIRSVDVVATTELAESSSEMSPADRANYFSGHLAPEFITGSVGGGRGQSNLGSERTRLSDFQYRGSHISIPISEQIGFRGDVTWVQFSRVNSLASIAHSLEPRLLSIGLVTDFFPSESTWYLSAGMRLNWNRLRGSSRLIESDGVTTWGTDGREPSIEAETDVAEINPYVGFGFLGNVGDVTMGFQAGAFLPQAIPDEWNENVASALASASSGILPVPVKQINSGSLRRHKPGSASAISPVLAISLGYSF